jgi:hypothetical protein
MCFTHWNGTRAVPHSEQKFHTPENFICVDGFRPIGTLSTDMLSSFCDIFDNLDEIRGARACVRSSSRGDHAPGSWDTACQIVDRCKAAGERL